MALLLQPPPPPPAPLSYTPPSESEIREINASVVNPLEKVIENVILYLQDLEDTPNESFKYHLLTDIYDVLNMEAHRPIWPILYPSSLFTDTITTEIRSLRMDLNNLPNQMARQAPPPQPPPTNNASVAALDRKIDDLKKETTSSLKSFAEVVKASVITPTLPPPHPPKAKNQPPALKGNYLPQAVIRYRGHVNPANRPSFVSLVAKMNTSLHDSPKHLHVRVVGVKWTSSSNLVVRAQAPSPSALVAALQAVQASISSDLLIINDIIPNTRWSQVTLSHVFSGKGPNSPAYDSNTLHEELALNNPNYALLTIRRPPNWIRNPMVFKDGQMSTISFAFEDPDGGTAHRLLGTSLTAFGNLRCTIKAWAPKKSMQEE